MNQRQIAANTAYCLYSSPGPKHSPYDWCILWLLFPWTLDSSSSLTMTISKWFYKAKLPKRHLLLTHGLVKVHTVALQGLFSWLSLGVKQSFR